MATPTSAATPQQQEQVQKELQKQEQQGSQFVGKSGKKICCACPETKKARDECIVKNGPEACVDKIEAHKQCLRADGFKID